MAQALSRQGIGGSEAAAAMGYSPYTPPIALWQRKVAELDGRPDPLPVVENQAIAWGNYLEQPIRQAYSDRMGVTIETPTTSMFHVERPWCRATPDGLAVDARGVRYGVEIKTASHRLADQWGEDGSDDVPAHYLIQSAWYMSVLDLPRWDIAALIGGSDFRCYTIRRDAELEAGMLEQVGAFWHHNVLERVEPDIDGSVAYKEYLGRKHPAFREGTTATEEMELILAVIRNHRETIKASEAELDFQENLLRARLADATSVDSKIGRVLYRPRKGRSIVEWETIARHIALHHGVGVDELGNLITEHSKRAAGSRPLLYRFTDETTPGDA